MKLKTFQFDMSELSKLDTAATDRSKSIFETQMARVERAAEQARADGHDFAYRIEMPAWQGHSLVSNLIMQAIPAGTTAPGPGAWTILRLQEQPNAR